MRLWSANFSFRPRRYVFKFVNGKDLINWFEGNYDIQVVFFFRHPIATALSRMKLKWPKEFYQRFIFMLQNEEFIKHMPAHTIQYANKKLNDGSTFEKHITCWCIGHYIPFNHLSRRNWLTLSYEELLMNTSESLTQLHNKLGLKDLVEMNKMINRPSGSAIEQKYACKKILIMDSGKDAKKHC